jgi:hypothetical protein
VIGVLVLKLKFFRQPTEKTTDGLNPGRNPPATEKKEDEKDVEETYGEDAE